MPPQLDASKSRGFNVALTALHSATVGNSAAPLSQTPRPGGVEAAKATGSSTNRGFAYKVLSPGTCRPRSPRTDRRNIYNILRRTCM